MMKKHIRLIVSFMLLLFGATAVDAADDKPGAYLRYENAGPAIEAVIPAKLKTGTGLAVTIYQTIRKIGQRIARESDVPDCAQTHALDRICKQQLASGRMEVTYLFPSTPESADKYSIAVSFTDENGKDIDELIKVSTENADIKPEVIAFDPGKKFYTATGFEKLRSRPNGVIKVTLNFPEQDGPGDTDAYIQERIDRVHDWLERTMRDPERSAAVRIEPLSKELDGNSPLVYTIMGVAYDPYEKEQAKEIRRINIFLVTDEDLPSCEFAAEVTFPNAPDELSSPITGKFKGVGTIATPSAAKSGDDRKLELREFKSNLDAAIAFTTSVQDKQVGRTRVRQRDSNTVFDLMFAPILNKALDVDAVHLLTPFFIDAKVSNGKITEKSLSLNRILIGTEYSIRWRPDDGTFNKYIFAFQGVNASDRDFKRAEAKLAFEFRPLFNKWNDPLGVQYVEPAPPTILIPENGPKDIPTGWFGYQIQPFAGFELGRVYRAKRTAFTTEDTDRNLRRFYFGTDMLFNITRHANLKLSDTFYFRGESRSGRERNYFKGEVEIPLLISTRTAQSVFFSFERGDLPPFVSPSVNSLKIGYRITSNLFGGR
jgi:hypothetical protein